MQSDQYKKEEAGLVKAKLGEQGGETGMNDGVIVTVDHIPTNAGLFASVLRMYGSDDVEVVTHDGREALWYLREVGHTGLPLLCRFVHFLRGRGR
jgi:hypothetical protein